MTLAILMLAAGGLRGHAQQTLAAKLGDTPSRADLVWSTYLGGSSAEYGGGVASDGAGNIYVTGQTTSSGWISGGFDTTGHVNPPDSGDAFVAKLSPTGQMLWSSYLGGTGSDSGGNIAVDGAGNVYLTGSTGSAGWVSGGFDTTFHGMSDGYVVKLSATGQHVWSTYLGGPGNDYSMGLALDKAGNIFATGTTYSTGWVSGGLNTNLNGTEDAFVVKLSPAGQHLWSTYLGGSDDALGDDGGAAVATDSAGNVYATGTTGSADWFNTQFDSNYNGYDDAFVIKLSATGQFVWGQCLGGPDFDFGRDLALDGMGNVYVAGVTHSLGWVSGGFQTTGTGAVYGFVAKLTAAGQPLWSSYLGGGVNDTANGVAADSAGNAYVTGYTASGGWVAGEIDNSYGGSGSGTSDGDAYVIKLSPGGQPIWSSYLGGDQNDQGTGIDIGASGTVCVVGSTFSSSWIQGGYDTSYGGNGDAFVTKIHDNGMPGPLASLGVTLTPPSAVAAGAQWRRLGTTAWHDSGTTETGVPAGACMVEFKTTPGWVAPGNTDLTLASNQAVSLAKAYERGAGLQVTLAPAEAVAAGAQWRRAGTTAWLDSGTSETSVPAGPWDVEFKAAPGWTMPANLKMNLAAGQMTTTSTTYVRSASLIVTLTPAQAASSGARWRRVGTMTWRSSGTTETGIAAGACQVEFSTIAYYTTPASVPAILTAGGLTSVTATYVHQIGSLQVGLAPAKAVTDGAKWRRQGTTPWLDSGTIESTLPAGLYMLEFNSAGNGWSTPNSRAFIVYGGKVSTTTVTYGAVGTLRVAMTPSQAVAGGAKWRRQGTLTWHDSGTSESALNTGGYSVEYSTVNGWVTPARKGVSIAQGQVTDVVGTYIELGSLTVTITPPEAAAAGAKWRRVGTTLWQASGGTEKWITAGSYAVEFLPVSGWVTPPNQNITITNGQTTAVTCGYIMLGGLRVNITPPEAVAAGAQWRLTGTTAWLDSGDTENNVVPGMTYLDCKPVNDWAMLDVPAKVMVKSGQTTVTTINYTLVPTGMNWSTYLGGSNWDEVNGIAVDRSDNIYATGDTQSAGWVSGGFDTTFNGTTVADIFVAKMSPTGQHLWSTYLGGDQFDMGSGITVDNQGNVYITGITNSGGWASGAPSTIYHGGIYDAFVAKLSPTGQHLWSTYIGGNQTDHGNGIALDPSGNILLTGTTWSSGLFSGGYNLNLRGNFDAFVVKLSPSGQILWGSYLGGLYDEFGVGVASDHSGNVCVMGNTDSPGWVSGGYDTSVGYHDAFVAKLTPDGQHLWSTYIGGDGTDDGTAMALDNGDNIYVTGFTLAAGWVSGGGITNSNTTVRGFLVKLSPAGQHLWSSYLAATVNNDNRTPYGIATDSTGGVYMTGVNSGAFIYPFLMKFSSLGQYVWTAPVGPIRDTSSNSYMGKTVALDSHSNIVVGGVTDCPGWTTGGYNTTYGGNTDGFVAKYRQGGTLWVTLAPAQAVSAGAQWRRVGTTTWLNSGATDANAPAGVFEIEFKNVADWTAPGRHRIVLKLDQALDVNDTYRKYSAIAADHWQQY